MGLLRWLLGKQDVHDKPLTAEKTDDRSPTGRKDWRESHAHLLLLSKFLRPSTENDYDGWRTVLEEMPQLAIARLQHEEMLSPADLAGHLAYQYKVPDLKRLLKERNLPVSGRKDKLIERLVQADADGMQQTVAELKVLRCTAKGQQIAEDYLVREKEKRTLLEQQVLEALQAGRFQEASERVVAYEAQQVFPRGLGVDWKNHDVARDVEILEYIFHRKPEIFQQVNNHDVNVLRTAAAMGYLFGVNRYKKWLPADFESELPLPPDVAASKLIFHGTYLANLAQYRQMGAKRIKILDTSDSCDNCRKLASKTYAISEVPELPHSACTNEQGCRCVISVDTWD